MDVIKVPISEQELVGRLKNGESEAYTILAKSYQERLYWHIRNLVKNHDDADDVLQNVFIKVYRNISNFNEESKLYTWLYRIASNESFTFLSKRAKQQNISSEELQKHIVDNLESDVYFEGTEIQLKLQKAIASLPPKQQQVFQMKYFEDITYDAMSAILETSVGALKSSYHIAVKKITIHLKAH